MPWQPTPIIFPDAEMVLSQRTRTLLADPGVFVGNRIPSPRRPRMVIWNRDGGGSDGMFDLPRMRCRVWDVDDEEATTLANLVAALVERMADGAPILSVTKESGPYTVADTSGSAQKYLLFQFRTRGVPA